MQTTIHTFSFRFFWDHLCQLPSTELIQSYLDSSFFSFANNAEAYTEDWFQQIGPVSTPSVRSDQVRPYFY